MAEKEYIEREAAIAVIYGQHVGGKESCENARPNTYGADLREIVADIEDIPASDVRPVGRGEWSVQEIYKHEMSYGTTAYEPVYKCSACGNLMESYLRYDKPIMPEDADFPRFCPNCGADMREES